MLSKCRSLLFCVFSGHCAFFWWGYSPLHCCVRPPALQKSVALAFEMCSKKRVTCANVDRAVRSQALRPLRELSSGKSRARLRLAILGTKRVSRQHSKQRCSYSPLDLLSLSGSLLPASLPSNPDKKGVSPEEREERPGPGLGKVS